MVLRERVARALRGFCQGPALSDVMDAMSLEAADAALAAIEEAQMVIVAKPRPEDQAAFKCECGREFRLSLAAK